MALQKTSVFVPLGGALDSQKAPLSMPSTSLLTCDNVTQERRGEWRRRYGFTQTVGDSLTFISATAPFQVATIGQGPTGQSMVAVTDANSIARFDTIIGSWVAGFTAPKPSTITRAPLVACNDIAPALAGFSSDGSEYVCTVVRTTGLSFTTNLYVAAGKVANPTVDTAAILLDTVAHINAARCASLPGFLCVFWADTSGNLKARVRTSSTGVWSAATTMQTGLDAATPLLDAMYYTGSTITVICQMAAAAGIRFIEFNPSTLANAVNSGPLTPATYSCASLIPEPSGSGNRFIGYSTTAPGTFVRRFDSGGGFFAIDTVQAIQSTQITGCATNSGTDWAVVFTDVASAQLRRNTRVGGVVGSTQTLNNISAMLTPGVTLASGGWGASGDSLWYFTVAQNNSTVTLFQRTMIIQGNTFAATDNIMQPVASVAPLGTPTTSGYLYQAVGTPTGAKTVAMGIPVATSFELASGAISADYVFSMFTFAIPASSDTPNIGRPAYRNGKPIFCGQSLFTVEGSSTSASLVPVGTFSPPALGTITQAAGGSLTALAIYEYVAVLETVTQDGLLWRGPPTVPSIVTLTGANQQTTGALLQWQAESFYQLFRLKFYRSAANGSVPTLLKILYGDGSTLAGSLVFIDTASDASIAAGEVLYTVGEQPNMCWPPSSHCWIWDDRLWAVNRDYRTEVQYSKNIQATRQPETTLANVIDLDDQWGDITGGSSVEGRCVIFKRNAIYFVQGDGLTDAGSGNNYTVTRVSDDVGALPGSPLVNAGDAIYFVSQRGIYSVDAQGNIKFVGAGIDQWVNQPQVNTPEVFYDGIFVPSKNEVRFVTTNYVFVYDRKFPDQGTAGIAGSGGLGQWIRWTGLSGMRRCLLVNDQMVLFKNDGTVWREGTSAQTTDQGTAFTGIVRTGWVRYNPTGALVPAPVQGGMRTYNGRVVFTRIAGGGTVTMTSKLYFNDDDAQVQTFTSQNIVGATLTDVGEFFPTQQKCTSVSGEVQLPSGDATIRVQGFALNIGVRKPSEQRRPAGEKWS
jgi:hypothetical protein